MPLTHRSARRVATRAWRLTAAYGLLTGYWLLLRLRPGRVLHNAVAGGAALQTVARQRDTASLLSEMISVVERAAAFHPFRPRCLERSLACRALLAAHGEDARVVVGIRLAAGLDVHAWVEVGHHTNDAARPAFTTLMHLP